MLRNLRKKSDVNFSLVFSAWLYEFNAFHSGSMCISNINLTQSSFLSDATIQSGDKPNLTLLEVPKLKRNKRDESKKTPHQPTVEISTEIVGDDVDKKSGTEPNKLDEKQNELDALRLSEKSPSIYMLDDTPKSPKSKQTKTPGSSPRHEKINIDNSIAMSGIQIVESIMSHPVDMGNAIESDFIMDSSLSPKHSSSDEKYCGEPAQIIVEIVKQDDSIGLENSHASPTVTNKIKSDMVIDTSIQHTNADGKSEEPTQIIVEIINEEISSAPENSSDPSAVDQNEEKNYESQSSSEISKETQPVPSEMSEAEQIKCVKHLKPAQISHDTPSSDFSDTETNDKVEKAYTESGVDETSRDERDEVSEIENFDLSSCGEDSLEAMYYMIRKNEIIMDRSKPTPDEKCDDNDGKMQFPDAATDELSRAVREVSGKKVKLCSIDSMNSSADEVVLKKLSSDSDELQLHVIPDSEIDSSSEQKSCPSKSEKGECNANDSTDDEFIKPILDSMQKNEDTVNDMHAKAMSVHPQCSDTQSDDQQLESDTFNEHLMDDMVRGNIERKIFASSVSEADSDYFEMPPSMANRLTKDDFNVSTAFEHMIRDESTTTDDSESTIESAATKIQAGARGFLTRRRLRKSSAGTSASNEKRASFGNAAIDKSLDNLIEQQELMEEAGYSESVDENATEHRHIFNDQTIDSIDSEKILGITEVKVEQRIDDSTKQTGNDNNEQQNNGKNSVNGDENVPEINIQGTSEDSATAQRRLMLQRGDAMQRNSTPESSEQQHQHQHQQQQPGEKQKSLIEPNQGANLTEHQQHAEEENNDIPKIASARANGKSNVSNNNEFLKKTIA